MAIVSIDQGTTGTTTIVYDRNGAILARAYREFTQYYPKPGWVEHDPLEIWKSVTATLRDVLSRYKGPVEAVGITNQRETTIVWNRDTGKPVHNAIVWQCRRTADICESFRPDEKRITEITGLPLDAYFSASKIRWLLDNADIQDTGNLIFGTIDTWLIWNLTGGAIHATDMTNASRTMLFNISTLGWDHELLTLFDIPRAMLPEVKQSTQDFGTVTTIEGLEGVHIDGVAGDQQAALFGQACFDAGQIKNTYGTGSFMVMNTGGDLVRSTSGLVTTVAVNGDGKPCYALEGSIFIAGASIQWLRDELGILDNASQSEAMARSVSDNNGVYMVPAFTGLGAPHWDMKARGAIVGLTRGANKNHLARAALESMAYQASDVLNAMEDDTGITVERLMVDGGAVANEFLMQFQADIIGKQVHRPANTESTSLGAAMLAGFGAGIWQNTSELSALHSIDSTFSPEMDASERLALLDGWRHALRQAMCR